VESILETARLCAEANAKLPKKEKHALLAELPFEHPTFSKLAKIGSDPRIHADSIKGLLPPSYSIMYALSSLSDEQLQHAVDSGVLHPKATRTDIESLSEQEQERLDARPLMFGHIQAPHDWASDKLDQLEQELHELMSVHGATFVRRATAEERAWNRHGNGMNAYFRDWEAMTRRLARNRILELKREKLRGHKKLSAQDKAKRWGSWKMRHGLGRIIAGLKSSRSWRPLASGMSSTACVTRRNNFLRSESLLMTSKGNVQLLLKCPSF
jgi:hypothetical protein